MPPPKFSQLMSSASLLSMHDPRRRGSLVDLTADDVRRDLVDAFKRVDRDSSGFLDRNELRELIKDLKILLKDVELDIDFIFDALDTDMDDQISFREFSNMFEPTIASYQAKGYHMEINEIMKESFNVLLAKARAERDLVSYAFLTAGTDMEREHQGFGVNFWGWTWRTRIFRDFYAAPSPPDAAGHVIRSGARYSHLKTRLADTAAGDTAWVRAVTAEDARIRGELAGGAPAVQAFCARWLRLLTEAEANAAASPSAASDKDVCG